MNDLQPQNFAMLAGDSKVITVTVVDETGARYRLTGTQSITWRLARTARSVPILSKTLTDGVTIVTEDAGVDGANCGRMDVRIDSADSEPLDGEYFHDCQIVDASGARSTIFYGRANVTPNLA
ncbi:MAG: hypothetical protein WC803_08805 [Sphingomonas sp.]|jgi:hypothetical protein